MQIPPASIQALAGQTAATSRAAPPQSQQAASSAEKSRTADLSVLSSASREDVAEMTGDGAEVNDRDADGRQAWRYMGGSPDQNPDDSANQQKQPETEDDSETGGLDVVV